MFGNVFFCDVIGVYNYMQVSPFIYVLDVIKISYFSHTNVWDLTANIKENENISYNPICNCLLYYLKLF